MKAIEKCSIFCLLLPLGAALWLAQIIPGLDRTPPESNFAAFVFGDLRPGGSFQVGWTWDQDRAGCDWDATPFLEDSAGQVIRYVSINGSAATAPEQSPPPRQFTTGPREIPSSVEPGPAKYYLRVAAVCHKSQRDDPIVYTFGPAEFEILPN